MGAGGKEKEPGAAGALWTRPVPSKEPEARTTPIRFCEGQQGAQVEMPNGRHLVGRNPSNVPGEDPTFCQNSGRQAQRPKDNHRGYNTNSFGQNAHKL